jgi:hypothetical protein
VFWLFWKATTTVPSGCTVGTENWSSSQRPAPPVVWKVQMALLAPEISRGRDQLLPPLSLQAAKTGEAW